MPHSTATKIEVLYEKVNSLRTFQAHKFQDMDDKLSNICRKLDALPQLNSRVTILETKDAEREKNGKRNQGILVSVAGAISAAISWFIGGR